MTLASIGADSSIGLAGASPVNPVACRGFDFVSNGSSSFGSDDAASIRFSAGFAGSGGGDCFGDAATTGGRFAGLVAEWPAGTSADFDGLPSPGDSRPLSRCSLKYFSRCLISLRKDIASLVSSQPGGSLGARKAGRTIFLPSRIEW